MEVGTYLGAGPVYGVLWAGWELVTIGTLGHGLRVQFCAGWWQNGVEDVRWKGANYVAEGSGWLVAGSFYLTSVSNVTLFVECIWNV